MRAVLGYALLALPFMVITAGMILNKGWLFAAAVWATIIALLSVLALGMWLIHHD